MELLLGIARDPERFPTIGAARVRRQNATIHGAVACDEERSVAGVADRLDDPGAVARGNGVIALRLAVDLEQIVGKGEPQTAVDGRERMLGALDRGAEADRCRLPIAARVALAAVEPPCVPIQTRPFPSKRNAFTWFAERSAPRLTVRNANDRDPNFRSGV